MVTVWGESATVQLQQGKFAKVPYLIGSNTDEGTSFAVPGINTTEQFGEVISNWPSTMLQPTPWLRCTLVAPKLESQRQ